MIFFDASHTSHTRAQTGIQRVVRSSFAALSHRNPTLGVCFDPFQKTWRALDADETHLMQPGHTSAGSRGAKWPLRKKLRGHFRRLTGQTSPLSSAEALICPELFSPRVAGALPELFARVSGPRVALFHDAIGLKFPELTPQGTVTRLPAYLRELLMFDGIAAVSHDSAETLRAFWNWLGVTNTPALTVIPLGVTPFTHPQSLPANAAHPIPRILCVGTIEGRKNHLALLNACELLWAEGLQFELHVLGLARADTAAAALAKMALLQKYGRPLFHDGSASDAELHAAYARSTFTVYPSLMEGFGLPVIESLQHGKPCICSDRSALGESAKGGGCLTVDETDAAAFGSAIRRLLTNNDLLAQLSREATQRTFRSWDDYTHELLAWMNSLPRHA